MIISVSNNSDRSTGSAATSSASGLKDSDSEPHLADLQPKPLKRDTSKEVEAHNQGPISTFGTGSKPLPFSTACVIQGPFVIRSNGSLGLEILDADGRTAWTTNLIVAQVIVELMSRIAMDE